MPGKKGRLPNNGMAGGPGGKPFGFGDFRYRKNTTKETNSKSSVTYSILFFLLLKSTGMNAKSRTLQKVNFIDITYRLSPCVTYH